MNCTGDRFTATRTGTGQAAASAQARASTQAPSGTISPVSSATAMKAAGVDEAAHGMAPAHQRLEARHGLGGEVDLRLVVQLELAPLERAAQVLLQGAAAARLLVHPGLEDVERAAVPGLGAAAAPARRGAAAGPARPPRPPRGRQRDADRGPHHQVLPGDREGPLEAVEEPRGQAPASAAGPRRTAPRRTRPRRAGPRRRRRASRREPLAHGLEQRVPRRVAQRVVEDAEAVEVDQQQRQALPRPAPRRDGPPRMAAKEARLGRPVRSSNRAARSSRRSSSRRSVTSSAMPSR